MKNVTWFRMAVAVAVTAVTVTAHGEPASGEPTVPQLSEAGPPLTEPVVPTPTPVDATPTPTPTPKPKITPTPAPDKCPFFEVRVKRHGEGQKSHSNPTQLFGDYGKLGCLKSYANSLHAQADKGVNFYYDDRIFFLFAQDYLGGNDASLGKRPNGFVCNQVEHIHGNKVGHAGDYCIAAVGYFDKNCQPVDPDDVAAQCGNKVDLGFQINFIRSSPISLLWEDGMDVDRESSIVHFSLHLGKQRPWSVWKGSAKAPLLVYDPQHTGKVSDVTQLFGSWTFGGKQTAALDSGARSGALAGPWDNGYEALAQLDRNGDGEIRGNELDALALWFDANRDAVSQPGEVVAIHAAQVTALRYAIDNRDAVSGTLHSMRGFERTVNGVVHQGASADWYGETAETEFQLINALFFAAQPEADALKEHQLLERTGANPEPAVKTGNINGTWQWNISGTAADENETGAQAGMFVFSESKDSAAFKGYSFVELPFQDSPSKKLGSAVHSFMMLGEKKLVDGKTTLAFEVARSDAKLRSNAFLSEDGNTLTGTTEAALRIDGRNRIITYGWTAARFVGK